VGTAGGQVTGRLLTAPDDEHPGEPVAGGELAAVTVGEDPVLRWYRLPFLGEPTVSAPECRLVAAWLELQPGYGEVECALTTAKPDHLQTPGGPLRHRMSGGATRPTTVIAAIGPLNAALRVVGVPGRDHPLAAVRLEVVPVPVAVTLQSTVAEDALDIEPTGDDLVARLTLHDPLPAAPGIRLRAICAAPGSLVLDTVRVTYRESG
jgi:hypothetical protein